MLCGISVGCVGWVGSILGSVTRSISHGTVEARRWEGVGICSTGVLRRLVVLCVDVMDSGDDNREVAPGLGSTVDVGDVMVSGSLVAGFLCHLTCSCAYWKKKFSN